MVPQQLTTYNEVTFVYNIFWFNLDGGTVWGYADCDVATDTLRMSVCFKFMN